LIGILIFVLVRSPCKNLESFDHPFWVLVTAEEKKINYLK
jgi:hypothetical protein